MDRFLALSNKLLIPIPRKQIADLFMLSVEGNSHYINWLIYNSDVGTGGQGIPGTWGGIWWLWSPHTHTHTYIHIRSLHRNDRVYDTVPGIRRGDKRGVISAPAWVLMWISALVASSDTGYRIIDEFVAVFIIPFNISVHLITLNDFIFKVWIPKTFEKKMRIKQGLFTS